MGRQEDPLDNLSQAEAEELNSFRDIDDNRDQWFEDFLPRAVEGIQSCYDKGHRVCVAAKLEELATAAFGASTLLKAETVEDLKEMFPN